MNRMILIAALVMCGCSGKPETVIHEHRIVVDPAIKQAAEQYRDDTEILAEAHAESMRMHTEAEASGVTRALTQSGIPDEHFRRSQIDEVEAAKWLIEQYKGKAIGDIVAENLRKSREKLDAKQD